MGCFNSKPTEEEPTTTININPNDREKVLTSVALGKTVESEAAATKKSSQVSLDNIDLTAKQLDDTEIEERVEQIITKVSEQELQAPSTSPIKNLSAAIIEGTISKVESETVEEDEPPRSDEEPLLNETTESAISDSDRPGLRYNQSFNEVDRIESALERALLAEHLSEKTLARIQKEKEKDQTEETAATAVCT